MQLPVPQPAKAVLAGRRITNRTLAAAVGMSEHYVGRVLNGWQAPSAEFRAAVAEFVDVPEELLFRPDWLLVGEAV